MASLRSLIDKFEITNDDIEKGTVEISQYNGDVFQLTAYCQEYPGCCDAYNRSAICNWCVPAGVSCAVFHVWGAGGSGAGACCCQQGVPGTAGAYARKAIPVTEGDCYTLCAGQHGQCSVGCIGCRGCKSYVTGPGLTNFCADGGCGGKTCCFAYYNEFGNCPVNVAGGEVSTNSQTYAAIYGYYCMDHNVCAEYFGADCGAPGLPGFFYAHCRLNPNIINNCWVKLGIPYPGGIISEKGGWVHQSNQGNACNNEWLKCSIHAALGGNYMARFPGVGGVSATSCGNPCCYGLSGGPGFLRIEYR